jgi:hypothetical protein
MKKIGFIVLAVVLALGLVGAAFAYWSQPLYVNGNVTTGTLLVEFNAVGPAAAGPNNVGSGIAQAQVTTGIGNYEGTNNVVTVTIANAYPGMDVSVPFSVGNYGSLEAQVSPSVSGAVLDSGDQGLLNALDVSVTPDSTVIAPQKSATAGIIDIFMPNTDDNTLQGQTCVFTVTLTANQYNP